MADAKTLTEEDEELIPIVEGEEPKPDEKPDEKPDASDEPEDEGDDEDERLATSEDDSDAEISANAKRRKQRREASRLKREETARELEMLRQQNRDLAQRLGAVEGHAVQSNVQQIEARYTQTLEDIRQAEAIYAKAITDGQGEYAAQAMRIRDAAREEAQRLAQAHQQLKAEKPGVDPRTASHAQEWLNDNKWYDPSGADPTSALTKRIDAQIAAEGYDPTHRVYWEELTKRVTQAIQPAGGKTPAAGAAERRSAPPMGTQREHAPTSTRKSEIRVTPERKAAMVEAGIWDDPVRRQRVLKEYREFDKASAR